MKCFCLTCAEEVDPATPDTVCMIYENEIHIVNQQMPQVVLIKDMFVQYRSYCTDAMPQCPSVPLTTHDQRIVSTDLA